MTPHPVRCSRLAAGAKILVVCWTASFGPSLVFALEPESIGWHEDYAAALEEARAGNRLLWIQFTGPWCPNCVRMERETFPSPPIVERARKSFVPLKLRSDLHEQLAVQFNLSGLPATVVVSPSREILSVHQGYLSPRELDTLLRTALLLGRKGESRSNADAPTRTVTNSVNDRPLSHDREPSLALLGYCPVSLVCQRKLVQGRSEHATEHLGRTYLLASADMSERFRNDPDRFVPANDGFCPVSGIDRAAIMPGNPRWGVLYRSRLFVFAREEDRQQFMADPDRYALVDLADSGFCPHCIRQSGLLVRGDPRLEIARGGRRYWFPSLSHKEAFLESLR
jgi:YHS domain-containing protein